MVRLERDTADTLRYYARARSVKLSALAAVLLVLVAVGIWQAPAAADAVTGWAAAVSGRDEALDAQAALSDAVYAAREALEGAPTERAQKLRAVLAECEDVRMTRQAQPMNACTDRLVEATRGL